MPDNLNDFPFADAIEGQGNLGEQAQDLSFMNEFSNATESSDNDQIPEGQEQLEGQKSQTEEHEDKTNISQQNTVETNVEDVVSKTDYEKVLAEKTELEQKLSSMTQEELDEHSRVIYDHIKSGDLKALKEYLDVQTTDYSAVPQESLVRDYLKAKNPKWTDDDINDEMSQRFGLGLDFDLLTDQEKRRYNRELSASADEALNYFESRKKEVKLPEISVKQTDSVDLEKIETERREQIAAWEKNVDESLSDFSKINIPIKDGDQLEFSVENAKELVQDIKELGKDVGVFFKPYIQDGKVNTRKLAEDMAFLKNKESIIRTAVAQQLAKEKEEWIKNSKNTQMSPQDRSTMPEQRDVLESFADKW